MEQRSRMWGIQKDQYDPVMVMWEQRKTSTEIADIMNRDYRQPNGLKLINHKTVNRIVNWARQNKDPRAVYHGPRNLSPTPSRHIAARKPRGSLFRRRSPSEYAADKKIDV